MTLACDQPSGPLAVPAAPAAALAAGAVAVAVLLAGIVVFADVGALTARMALHLAIMNVAAPLVALAFAPDGRRVGFLLWPSALIQILLLWAWHVPAAAQGGLAWEAASTMVLACASLAFWIGVAQATRGRRWGAVACLLITGKLACLLGALMTFAPRDLYGLPALALGFCTIGPSSLEDQQLAGLLMLTACPLSYVLAAVMLTAAALGRDDPAPARRAPLRDG